MTTYWTLEEITGRSERTLRRHLAEDGHSWSEAIKRWIDFRVNYGTVVWWNDETQADEELTRPIGLVVRFSRKPATAATPG